VAQSLGDITFGYIGRQQPVLPAGAAVTVAA